MKWSVAGTFAVLSIVCLSAHAVVPRSQPLKIVADCRPLARAHGSTGVRVMSNSATGDVRAIVYDLVESDPLALAQREKKPRAKQQAFLVQNITGRLFSGKDFFLKIGEHDAVKGFLGGLSTRFQGRIVREKLACEFDPERTLVAQEILAAKYGRIKIARGGR